MFWLSLLALHGAADPNVPPGAVTAFEDEMTAANVDWQLVKFGGAVHAFTNPDADELGKRFNMPLAYNAEADKDS